MIRERKKILFHRLFWFVFFAVGVIIPVIMKCSREKELKIIEKVIFTVIIYLDIFSLVFFISSLTLSYKKYEYNGNEIIVYAGWFYHYIKVNGVKMDEYNTLTSWTAISLSCMLDDGTVLNAVISTMNRITLKINNRLYKNK